MRPVRLELDGFAAFAEATVLDFAGAEYFALVGPGGSGTAAVVDAIGLALYGLPPGPDGRHQAMSALAPGMARGSVALTFDVGASRYVVARELGRAEGGGLTERDAGVERLLDPGDPRGGAKLLAADADVTPCMERLLGMDSEWFRTCLVPPQGYFADVLHLPLAQQREELARVLGLEVYQTVAGRAVAEADTQRKRAERLEEQLGDYRDSGDPEMAAADRRIEDLSALVALVEGSQPSLARADHEWGEAQRTAERLRAEAELLADARAPDVLAELADRARASAERMAAARAAQIDAEREDRLARAAVDAVPDPVTLRQIRRDRAELAGIAADSPNLTAEVARAKSAVAEARAATEQAESWLQLARERHAQLARTDQFSRRTSRTRTGATPADGGAPAHRMSQLRAMAAVQTCRAVEDDAVLAEQDARDVLRRATRRRQELTAALEGAPSAAETADLLSEFSRRTARAKAAAAGLATAHAELAEAAASVDLVSDQLRRSWRELAAVRDPVVVLGAPAILGHDGPDGLAVAWQELSEWAGREASERRNRADAAVALAREVRVGMQEALLDALRTNGLQPTPGREVAEEARVLASAALDQARETAERLRERWSEALELSRERDAAREQDGTATALVELLGDDPFQRWLLASSVAALVADGDRWLSELSGGRFGLQHADAEILLVDHNAADSRQPVRCLPAGQTFQVSLALALAFAGQPLLPGEVGLDSILLEPALPDPGQGALDEADLDLVADTLDTLAALGERMIGVVTEVPELAERVPVRYLVDAAGGPVSIVRDEW